MDAPNGFELLRQLRRSAGLTIADLAAAAGVGVRTIGDIERGVARRPQRPTLEALAQALDASQSDRSVLLRMGRGVGVGGVSKEPLPLADFTGRAGETGAVGDHLLAEPAALVMITGGPGIGKSTIALEAFRDDRRETLFVDLAAQSSAPVQSLNVLQRLIFLATNGAEDPPPTLAAAMSRWQQLCAEQAPAVILDDAHNEAQVRPVLDAPGRGPVVVTSRRLLSGLDATLRVAVEPMPIEESVGLLARIVPSEGSSDNLRDLASLCSGVPLALRVAGSRIAASGETASDFVAAMRAEERRLRMLAHHDVSVEAAFAVSYRDLEANVARQFRALAVIDGATFGADIATAPLGTAASRGDAAADTEDSLEELVELGLVEPRGGNRYRVHDLLRVFALEQLVIAEGSDAITARRELLRSVVLARLRAAAGWFSPAGPAKAEFPDSALARAWITAEVDHWWPAFEAAFTEQRHTTVVEVADALQWFSNLWPAWGHWWDLFGHAVDAAKSQQDSAAASRLLGRRTWAALMERGDREAALDVALEGQAEALRSGKEAVVAEAEYHVAWALLVLRRPEEALPHIEAAVAGHLRTGNRDALLQCRSMYGAALHLLSRHEEAIEAFRVVLAELPASSSDPGTGFTRVVALEEISKSAIALERWDEAEAAAGDGFAVASEMAWDIGAVRALRQRSEARLGAGLTIEAYHDAKRGLAMIEDERNDAQAVAVRAELESILGRLTVGTDIAGDVQAS